MARNIGQWFSIALIAVAAGQAVAETRVDAKADWSVFKADGGAKECWIASAPTSSVAKRGGKDVTKDVSRSDIKLMITVRPKDNARNEISFSAGYPLKKGSTVNVKVGGSSFEMFSEGEWGWLSSSAEDDQMVTAMKRGSVAVVTAQSQRGTQTTDTFSLKGLTSALEAAQDLCK